MEEIVVPMVTSPVVVPRCDDVDSENMGDPQQVSLYVNDIFNYYKEREVGLHTFERHLVFDLSTHQDARTRKAVLQHCQYFCHLHECVVPGDYLHLIQLRLRNNESEWRHGVYAAVSDTIYSQLIKQIEIARSGIKL